MSKATKYANLKEFTDRKKVVERAGYSIATLTPYQFRITRLGSWQAVDVWPSSLTMMQVGAFGTRHYSTLANLVKNLDDYFEIDQKKRDAEKAVSEFRKDPLAKKI